MALDGVAVLDVGQDLDASSVSVQGVQLFLHDWNGCRTDDLSRCVAHDCRVKRWFRRRVHGRNICRLLHRVDTGAQHEYRVHPVRLGDTNSGRRTLRPVAQAGASNPLRPRFVYWLESDRDRLLDSNRGGAVVGISSDA